MGMQSFLTDFIPHFLGASTFTGPRGPSKPVSWSSLHLGLAGTSFHVPEGAVAPYGMVEAVGSTVTFELVVWAVPAAQRMDRTNELLAVFGSNILEKAQELTSEQQISWSLRNKPFPPQPVVGTIDCFCPLFLLCGRAQSCGHALEHSTCLGDSRWSCAAFNLWSFFVCLIKEKKA